MALYTTSYFKRVAQNNSYRLREKLLSESRVTHRQFDIFLSYNFNDREIVEGIYWELIEDGYKVYLDFIVDPQLQRDNVTKESAEKIRERLKSSKSLVFAISENAILSKWMPWELGYVDGHTSQCVLLPVSDKAMPSNSYQTREFLSLYPYIKQADIGKGKRKYVVEAPMKYVWLKDLINDSKKPFIRERNIEFL